jgi:hypothetical protein
MTPRSNGRLPAAARGALAALSAMVAMLSIYPACPARAATARDSRFQPNLERTVRYLQNAQRGNGGFAEPGSEPGSDFTAWVTLALAAAGINPRDQTTAKQHWVGGHSAYSYLAEHAHEASLTTDFERELLVVDAAGISPHDFGGVDLVGEILKRQIATGGNAGAFPHEAGSETPGVNDTIFAILSLSPIHEPAIEEALNRATQWLEAQQKCDGSWNWMYTPRVSPCNPKERRLLPGEEGGEIDMTGAALEALNAVKHPDPEGQKQAFEYLREGETPNGGVVEFLGEREPNVASTAWVVQAMWSAGTNPEEWLTHSGLSTEEPLGYLASMQQEDGHIRYRAGEEMNGMWMTAYVTPAFAGDPLPISEVPFIPLPALPPEEPDGNGDGEVSTNPGGGVIVGGGGNGAPLFSRPQPDSKGHTPGGVRLLTTKHTKKHKTKHRRNPGPARRTDHRRDPGPARRTPAPTTTIVVARTSRHHHHRADAAHKDHRAITAHNGKGRGSASAGAGGGALADRISVAGTGADGGEQAGWPEVRGVLVGAPSSVDTPGAIQPSAPGLHGAGAGDNQTSWLAIGIAAAALALALVGALVELRRPQVIL